MSLTCEQKGALALLWGSGFALQGRVESQKSCAFRVLGNRNKAYFCFNTNLLLKETFSVIETQEFYLPITAWVGKFSFYMKVGNHLDCHSL
jgi:hypothetical protein